MSAATLLRSGPRPPCARCSRRNAGAVGLQNPFQAETLFVARILRETPMCSTVGMYTRSGPAERCASDARAFCPSGSLAICTIISCLPSAVADRRQRDLVPASIGPLSGLASGRPSGRLSGRPSGRASGRLSGAVWCATRRPVPADAVRPADHAALPAADHDRPSLRRCAVKPGADTVRLFAQAASGWWACVPVRPSSSATGSAAPSSIHSPSAGVRRPRHLPRLHFASAACSARRRLPRPRLLRAFRSRGESERRLRYWLGINSSSRRAAGNSSDSAAAGAGGSRVTTAPRLVRCHDGIGEHRRFGPGRFRFHYGFRRGGD